MRSLSLKLTLLFVVIALVSVVVIALWVNRSVQTEFISYCQQGCSTVFIMGALEQTFLDAFRNSLVLATVAAILVAILLGLVFSRFITNPVRQLALSAKKVASGDFSQRVRHKTKDEIGELSASFNSMAEQLDKKEKSRRQLLADIAHELRNPLSIVQGNLEAWRDGVITPTSEQITSVYDETVLLSRLITDLRDLSLAEAGQLKLHQTPARVDDLIAAEVSSIGNRYQEKQVSIQLELPSDLPLVLVDSDRIRQVLHNLLDNALRYTPTGSTIQIGANSSPEGWVTVWVSDSGTGIDPKDLPHIFDHFHRADWSRRQGYSGAGIGLAVVKQLVEAHKGKVWVESKPGSGSCFYFTLPAV